jgi:peptidoglycan/xylan/chitin deacetylase (PgdA/CDA1 family)
VPPASAGRDWERIPTSRKIVALTFDAGANADAVPSILATLSREGVPGTFFLTGDFVHKFPAAARTVASAHRVGNHSQTHPRFTSLSDQQIRGQIQQAEQEIKSVTGRDPRPLFRFPFGDRDARTIAAVNGSGYVPIRWTVDTLGWKGTSGGMTTERVVDRVLAALIPGEIVLMHVGSHPTDHSTLDAAALPSVITTLRAHGYGFVTLDLLFT